MFEGSIVPTVVDRMAEGDPLRSPGWGETVARLAAAGDPRRAMTAAGGDPAGNFGRFGERSGNMPRRRQRLVNHDDLVHGKGQGGKTLPPQMAR